MVIGGGPRNFFLPGPNLQCLWTSINMVAKISVVIICLLKVSLRPDMRQSKRRAWSYPSRVGARRRSAIGVSKQSIADERRTSDVIVDRSSSSRPMLLVAWGPGKRCSM